MNNWSSVFARDYSPWAFQQQAYPGLEESERLESLKEFLESWKQFCDDDSLTSLLERSITRLDECNSISFEEDSASLDVRLSHCWEGVKESFAAITRYIAPDPS